MFEHASEMIVFRSSTPGDDMPRASAQLAASSRACRTFSGSAASLRKREVATASIACLSLSGTAVSVIYPKVRGENCSEPPGPLEAPVEVEADREDDPQHERIAEGPAELGHVLEVHPVDPSEHGRDGGNRDPGGDFSHVFVLLHRDLGQVRFQGTVQELPEGLDPR